MRLEYGLVENALDSLRESMAYYTEGDETHNVNQYKFSILLAAHCAELLLKEILRRNHPALLFENIAREFKRDQNKFEIEYINKKYIAVCCPNCATESLSISDGKIICKFCGADFENYSALHAADRNCITQEAILREFGRRKHLLRSRVFACPECENNSVIHLPDGTWMCLVCGSRIEETMYCDECGDEIPNSNRIYKTAISDTDADDFRFLCPDCAKRYTEEEQFMGYALE